jgi:hypothetical protein
MHRSAMLLAIVLPTAVLLFAPPDGVTAQEGCFFCVDGGAAGCPTGYHRDNGLYEGDYSSGRHEGCHIGTCEGWDGDGHTRYNFGENLAASGDDLQILKLIQENEGIYLNVKRNAIQVLNIKGEVLSHTRLKEGQGHRLRLALADFIPGRIVGVGLE